MVLPLIAAQMAGDVAKKIGEQASVTVIDLYYQPMISIPKKILKGLSKAARDKIFVQYPMGEVPDPHFPHGVRIAIPAWLVTLILAIGGVALLSFFIGALLKGIEKKMDPMEILKSAVSNPFKDLKVPWG